MRTFIAIELPLTIQATLAGLQGALNAQIDSAGLAARVRWSNVEKVHLTLRFLGKTNQVQVNNLRQELKAICFSSTPFALHLSKPGCFPNCSRPRVLWLGVGGDVHALQSLQEQIELSVQQAGFDKDPRSFSPHITLGRVKRHVTSDDVRRLGDIVQRILGKEKTEPFLSTADNAQVFSVQDISHMRSDLHPSGARYSPIYRIHLGRG